MSGSLTCVIYVALGCIVAAVGFQLTGFFTNYWFTGSSDSQDDDIVKISLGLWKEKIQYRNGTVIEMDSVLNIREEHYIMLSEAVGNFLLCFIVLFKNIHVCVGIIAFVNMTLLLLSAFYSFVHLEDAREDLQKAFSDWPEMAVAWSFYFVWLGILVNIVATGAFLTALLIKGEIKATKSSKGLGPVHEVVVGGGIEEEKVVRVATVSGDNYGYSDETDKKHIGVHVTHTGASYPGSSYEPVKTEPEIVKSHDEDREPDSIKPEDINVPNLEEKEAGEPYYIGKVNADDAEDLEFGYEPVDSELTDIIDQIANEVKAREDSTEPDKETEMTGSSPEQLNDSEIIESSRL